MREIRVVIADMDEKFIGEISDVMKRDKRISIVGTCSDGMVLSGMINDTVPDAVLTELVLKGIDGIEVMKRHSELENRPAFIVCTDFYNEVCIRRARKYGASAFLCKPVYTPSVVDAIIESCSEKCGGISGDDIESEMGRSSEGVYEKLIDMGVSQDCEGFRYLCDAVDIVRRQPEAISAVTKVIYPELAKMNGTTAACAERNIRTAVQKAFRNGGLRINGRRPTNKEMIEYLAANTQG